MHWLILIANFLIIGSVQGKCYKLVNTKSSWSQAKTMCENSIIPFYRLRYGIPSLAIIKSKEENDFILSLKETTDGTVWIGLTDQETEGTYKWIDGSKATDGFNKWSIGEPNNYYENEDCVQMIGHGVWNDAPCDRMHHAVCQTFDYSELKPCRCGLAQRMNRIIGGEYTEPHEYPWMVRLGDHERGIEEENEKLLKIEGIVIHPNYTILYNRDNDTYNNFDFALVKIKPVNFEDNPNIRPICLPLARRGRFPNYDGYTGIATGFHNMFISIQGGAGVLARLYHNIMDDSGGPLITSGTRNGVTPGQNYEIVGVTSFGPKPCAYAKMPGVYGRVTEVMPWINKITSGSQTCPRY